MKPTTKRMVAALGLIGVAITGAPAVASAGGATLYELTENMKLTSRAQFQHRKATSELIGTADLGTPLCPTSLVTAVSPGATSCSINATGADNISLRTGRGDFGGTFTVVVQDNNAADSPESVVMRGSFTGKMDFSPAILHSIPLGYVTGKMRINGTRNAIPFTGIFRLPFVLTSLPVPDGKGATVDMECGPTFPCDQVAALAGLFGVPAPALPLSPMQRYDLTTGTRPLYLLDDFVSIVPVQASEFGAGWAAVKFEISF
jgi:hypothetical protein